MVRIAVCAGQSAWTARMHEALASEVAQLDAVGASWDHLDINRASWLDDVRPYDVVLWCPSVMGIKPSSHLKEKIYFLENALNKLVFPNVATTWHFESKVAQSFLFAEHGVPTPRTVATFDLDDALRLLAQERYPLVFKTSSDAASRGVRLVRGPRTAKWLAVKRLYVGIWWRILRRLLKIDHRDNVLYWQEFIPGNECDLRVTAVGTRYAVGFWRGNRPGDFRASGSGRLMYDRPIPEEAVRIAVGLNARFNFDSMAYDMVFRDGKPLVVEMSYTYVDTAVHDAPGYFEVSPSGALQFREEHVWPQQLWVRWLAERIRTRVAAVPTR